MNANLPAVASYFLRLGLTGFGGPVALAHYMRRDLVDRYGWIRPEEYDEGLAIATACPGPLAYQLGVYCGYILHGFAGAFVVAVAFAAAPFVIVTIIAMLYVQFGSTRILQGLFYGVEPVVVALIVRSCWDLGRKTLRGEWLAYTVAAIACAITVVVQQELVAIFLIAGALGIVIFYRSSSDSSQPPKSRPAKGNVRLTAFVPLTVTGYQSVAPLKLFWFFFKTGFLIFGSGLVVVPFLKAYVVDQYHWITNRAFLDAVAVGIVSPGPVVITATFVGYLTHHISGALAATAGIFAPSIVFVLLGTPILRRYRQNGRVQGFIRGITVAVVGVLIGTSYLVGRSVIHDGFTLIVLIGALAMLLSKFKVPEVVLIAAGAALGLLSITWTSPARADTSKAGIVIFSPWEHGQVRAGFAVANHAKGSCFTNALTTSRSDAWRCLIGNDIYDLQARVSEITQFTPAERARLARLTKDHQSWNPFVRNAAKKEAAKLHAGQQTRYEDELAKATRDFENAGIQRIQERTRSDERIYREYVGASLGLEDQIRKARAVLGDEIPKIEKQLTVLERTGVVQLECEGAAWGAGLEKLAAAVDRRYQALPQELRRDIEFAIRQEQHALRRSRESISMDR